MFANRAGMLQTKTVRPFLMEKKNISQYKCT